MQNIFLMINVFYESNIKKQINITNDYKLMEYHKISAPSSTFWRPFVCLLAPKNLGARANCSGRTTLVTPLLANNDILFFLLMIAWFFNSNKAYNLYSKNSFKNRKSKVSSCTCL